MGSLVMLLIMGLVGFVDQMTERGDIVSSVTSNDIFHRAVKPYIYQFDVVSQTGGESRRKIPFVWNQVWDAAGWTPQNLALEKYAADPSFKDVLDRISRVTILQRRIVYKYLAMAASGGGWLAHSDTFPLHPFGSDLELPNGGALTAFGGPCLMSGNATEWLRVGKEIAEHAHVAVAVHKTQDTWTEDYALSQIKNLYTFVDGEVFEVPKVENVPQWSWDPMHCQVTKNTRAVHFRLGQNEEFASLDDPGDMVVKWLSMWLQSCERSNVFINARPERRTEAEKPIAQVGSFHVSDNYDKDKKTEAPVEEPPVPAREAAPEGTIVKVGEFHANDTKSDATRKLRLRAMGGGV